MLSKNQKVVEVAEGADPTRAIRVQEATGDDDRVIPLEKIANGDPTRYQRVQVVAGGDRTRIPAIRFTTGGEVETPEAIGLEGSDDFLLLESGDYLLAEDTAVDTTAMPAATTLDGTELIPGVQAGSSVKVTTAQIRTYVNG